MSKHHCDLRHEFWRALILAPFVFVVLYLVAWPTIRPAPQDHETHQQ